METVEVRVARGAEWLDATSPGWEHKVNAATLRVAFTWKCVLGQVFEGVEQGVGGFIYAVGLPGCQATDMGFAGGDDRDAYPSQVMASFAKLDEAWLTLLKSRAETGAWSDGEKVLTGCVSA